MYLFTGHWDHRIDGKDRIVVPASSAAEIAASGEAALFLVPGAEGRYLEAYPADVFRQMAQGQVPSRFEGGQAQKRAFFQTAARVDINGPGRVTLPKRFLGYFPRGVVRIAGMNHYLELWDPELWEQTVGRVAEGGAPERGGAPSASGA